MEAVVYIFVISTWSLRVTKKFPVNPSAAIITKTWQGDWEWTLPDEGQGYVNANIGADVKRLYKQEAHNKGHPVNLRCDWCVYLGGRRRWSWRIPTGRVKSRNLPNGNTKLSEYLQEKCERWQVYIEDNDVTLWTPVRVHRRWELDVDPATKVGIFTTCKAWKIQMSGIDCYKGELD